jgi:4-hydroxythreonine-4-phosphate dehydrogenase
MSLIALTLGDPAGIGPELVVAAWQAHIAAKNAPADFFVIAPPEVLLPMLEAKGLSARILADPQTLPEPGDTCLPILDCGSYSGFEVGKPSLASARIAWAALETASTLARAGKVQAIVTAPVAKANLHACGFAFPGQTEFFAHSFGVAIADTAMMLAGPELRTVPLTIHIPLQDVPRSLSQEHIIRQARVVARALARDFNITHPRLAVAGLNPHAGEQGHIGQEEINIIIPAIGALQAEGMNISGPYSADALFSSAQRKRYDVALAMYHDQALIPIKTLSFEDSVNITLGLPIVRTAPDHGTAFDIAGKNQACPRSFLAALAYARTCLDNR